MGCLSPKRQNAPPLPLRTKFVEAEEDEEGRKRGTGFGLAQRKKELGPYALAKGGVLGQTLFG
jgi:hypothetical protein